MLLPAGDDSTVVAIILAYSDMECKEASFIPFIIYIAIRGRRWEVSATATPGGARTEGRRSGAFGTPAIDGSS